MNQKSIKLEIAIFQLVEMYHAMTKCGARNNSIS